MEPVHARARGAIVVNRRAETPPAELQAEQLLDLVPDRQAEQEHSARQHDEDEPEAKVREPALTFSLHADVPLRALEPVGAGDGRGIDGRRAPRPLISAGRLGHSGGV